MAIINSKGELKGKIGNVVYKIVNGKAVVASLPRRKKRRFKAQPHHERFKLATRVSSRVYSGLKEFFLNQPPVELSNKLTSFLIRRHDELYSSDPAAGWRKIPHEEYIRFPKRVYPHDILFGRPSVEIEGEHALINLPSSVSQSTARYHYRVPSNVRTLENSIVFIHYDFDSESAKAIYRWNSERYRYLDHKSTSIDHLIDDGEGDTIKTGLLMAALNIRAYVSDNSTSYLNNRNFNPLSILGVWVKG